MIKYKYKIIEYQDKSLTYSNGKINHEVFKTYHKTNSILLKYLIILCLRLSQINYEVIK